MKLMKQMLCMVIVLATVLCGCGQIKEVRKDSAPKQEEIKELCVLYTPENEVLIKNFENLYPEYKLEKRLLAGEITDELNRGRTPDLIIAKGTTPLVQWYESGIIQDLGACFIEDNNIKEEDYFHGALSVGREEGMLLALPISADISYMTVRKSVAAETAFGYLAEEYMLDEYLNVLEEEFSGIKEQDAMVVSGVSFCHSFIELLIASGAITIEEEQVQIDQAIFEKLYYICIEQCREYQEKGIVEGQYFDASIDPRDGEHEAVYWINSPPQVGVLYAQNVNRHLLDEDIDVFWWPMAGEAGQYAAEIATMGMIGTECKDPQMAYEVLRLMMDMPMKEWVQPQRNVSIGRLSMYMPVHIENAKELCSYVETTGAAQFSVVSLQKEYEMVEKQIWDEALKEKVLDMLDNIQYVYRMDSSIYGSLYGDVLYRYIDALNIDGATECYEAVVKHLQKKLGVTTSEDSGDYFPFTPMEYTTQLGEILEKSDNTRYSTEPSSEYGFKCVIHDSTQSEKLAAFYPTETQFYSDNYRSSISDPEDRSIQGMVTSLNDRDFENLFPLISAIIMTCDSTLSSQEALDMINRIPVYDTSKPFEEPSGSTEPYYHNGIGYNIEKWNFSEYVLIISIAEE